MRCLLLVVLLPLVWAQEYNSNEQLKCPQFWFQFQSSCYRFIKSPLRSRNDARKNCQAYEGDLASVSSPEEHGFLIYQLLWQDPQHRRWYVGGHQQSPGYWVNDGDGTSLTDLEAAFHPDTLDLYYNQQSVNLPRDYIVYKFSNEMRRWGFEKVTGEELLLYICEVPVSKIHYTLIDDRTFEYGVEVIDREKIPRGPYFVRQPVDVVFDFANRKTSANRVVLRCEARGYPWPDYEWYRIDYELDKEIEKKINPLVDSRITVSGGSLIIYDPKQIEDRGLYKCKASNEFGTIVSETVSLSFGAIGDFNLKRPQESGKENWGKVLNCDPPQHFSSVRYYWAREYFPNFVEEDKRVFVSFDGALYFSALERIDEGNYSCNVHSNVSKVGRNGPFFPLKVDSNSNYQQLKFANNFPKAFPEAPEAGKDVRLECLAFGYPVPSYNWTRRGSRLPRTAQFSSFNRVLTIHNVQVEDQGEYVCRVSNGRAALENSVILSIQAEPNFTIPLTDKHMDINGELVWTCEAFGIPDVTYRWYKNGELIEKEKLPPEDRERYIIQDNVLKINYLEPVRDPGMYQCEAKNILKTKYSSAQLRVLSLKPNFIKRPLREETYAAEGGNVSIVCNPEAAPKPEFTWKKDMNVIGSGGRRRILENGNLIISPVSRDDDGLYTCSARNIYGSDESKGRLVVLKGPTIIEELPPRVVTTVGKTVYYHCKASIDDLLEMAFSWKVNNLPLVSKIGNGHKIEVEEGYLKIVNVTFMDAGEYECVVLSSVGRASTKSQLTVRGYPGPPGGVQVLQITKKDAVVQWTDGATHGLETSGYIISGRTNWYSKWFIISDNVQFREVDRYNGRKEAAVTNLVPFSTYEFRVQARNSIGTGEPSLPSPKYRTDSDKPYKAPDKVGGGGGKIGDLVLSWEPLPTQHQNGPGIHYKIFWRKHKGSETEFQSLLLKEAGNTGVAVVRVPLDSYYEQYDVKVQAINDVGSGPESNITTIFSAEDMPQVAPQQVSARAFNSTAVNVTWTPIDQTREKVRGKLIGHRLKYWKKDISREEDSVYYLSRTTRPWSLIVGLQPNTYYFVKVMAYNAAGEGPESERFLEKTFRKAPQKPPASVNVYGVDPSTVRVVWRYVQPSMEEEPLQGYKVRVWEVDQDMSTANDTIFPVGSKLEAYIRNLSPGKSYHLRVLAFSLGGDGRMSSPAQTFQMGDAAAYRSTASRLYYRTLVVSLFVFIFHFNFNQIV